MYDKTATIEVLGSLIKKPDLILDENYNLSIDDFSEKFHKIVYGAINNLIINGIKKIDAIIIDEFISKYDKQYKTFCDNNGFEYIDKIIEISSIENFDYNFKVLKKYSVLRELKKKGFDISYFYEDDILDLKLQEETQKRFNDSTIQDIIDHYDRKILEIKSIHYQEDGQIGHQAGKGMNDLLKELQNSPEMGAPMCSGILNTIARGARVKKLYLRSGGTNTGKSRLAVGDACNISISEIYDHKEKRWIKRDTSEPTLLITTELEIEEVQTMIMAFVSDVSEDKILDGNLTQEEKDRICRAIEIINNSPLWVEQIPNFSIDDIERTIKKYKLEHSIGYVFFDYIFTSVKMLVELSQKSKGMKLREDNVLFIFAERMKFLCNSLNVHINTSTQLNGQYKDTKDGDQNLLRGSKAIADKIDFGAIIMIPTKKDLECLEPLINSNFNKKPNLVYHIYKVRRGKINRVKLWVYVDFGTCRTYDLFLTNNDYEVIDIESTTVDEVLRDTEVDEPINLEEEDFDF